MLSGSVRWLAAGLVLAAGMCDASQAAPAAKLQNVGAGGTLRLRGGSAAAIDETSPGRIRWKKALSGLNERQVRALPWYVLLEESAFRLGPGPYGLPYSDDRPSLANTEFARDPKSALGKQLFRACAEGSAKGMERLLKIGVDPNTVSRAGISCLAIAAHGGHAQVVESLIMAGADIGGKSVVSAVSAANDTASKKAVLQAIETAQAARAAGGGVDKDKVVKLFP